MEKLYKCRKKYKMEKIIYYDLCNWDINKKVTIYGDGNSV